MKKSELNKILREHKKWLDHKGGKKADLHGVDLRGTDLSGANLAFANLRGTDLQQADLHGADLHEADLAFASLHIADLTGANLQQANLDGVDLRYANLRGTNMWGANLRYADMRDTSMLGANLRYADMRDTDLRDANLRGADLREANLLNSNINHCTIFSEQDSIRKGMILAKPMTGYKKTQEGVIIKAEIPAGAVVFSINNGKCRTNMAKIVDMGGKKILHSKFSPTFSYKKDQTIIITDFDLNPSVECSTGFHFFRTRKEAETY